MLNFHVLLAIFFLFNAVHGLREWPQISILPSEHDVHQRFSSLEQKTGNEQESEELLNHNKSFTKLTLSENVYSNDLTEPRIINTKYQNDDLVLTTAITFRKENIVSDIKNAPKDDLTGYIKATIIENEDPKKTYQSLQNIESEYTLEGTSTVSELDFTVTTTENPFWVLTPARRIYYGHKTKIKHFPFLVTVHVFRRFVCGGSIIKSNLVITAASCLKRWQEWLHLHKKEETTIEDTTTDVTTTDETTKQNATTDMSKTYAPEKNATTDVPKTYAPEKDATIDVPKTYAPEKNATIDVPKTYAPEKNATIDVLKKYATAINGTTTAKSTENGTKTIPSGTITHAPTDTSNTSEEFETTLPPSKHYAISVRIGTNYYRLDGEVVQVVQVHIHPSYQEGNLQNNLAILKLGRHLIFNHRNIDNVDIRWEAADVLDGTNVTIAGWGAATDNFIVATLAPSVIIQKYLKFIQIIGIHHNKIFNALWNLIQKSVLTVIDRDECIKTYTSKFVAATNFCARNENNEGACNGDAGNPAVVDGELVGVTSFGSPTCGAVNATTVVTNLGYYTDWIKTIMADIPISKTSEEDSSHSIDTNHTKHKNHTKHTKHASHTNYTKHTNDTKHSNHTKHTNYTKHTKLTKHIKHTKRTKRRENTTMCYYNGVRYRNPSPVHCSDERYRKASPVYYSSERYRKASPVYYRDERYRKASPVYYSSERYRKASPVYYRDERYRKASPVYYRDERYRKASPVYYSDERYRKASPVYYSDERYRKASAVYYSDERYRKASPVYYSSERYQEQMNFQKSLTHWPRGYRRRFKDKLRETFTSLSSTHSLKLTEKITDSVKDSGFLTISPLGHLTSSMQYTHGSGINPHKSASSESKARMEENFLLTPNTPGISYDTTL